MQGLLQAGLPWNLNVWRAYGCALQTSSAAGRQCPEAAFPRAIAHLAHCEAQFGFATAWPKAGTFHIPYYGETVAPHEAASAARLGAHSRGGGASPWAVAQPSSAGSAETPWR